MIGYINHMEVNGIAIKLQLKHDLFIFILLCCEICSCSEVTKYVEAKA